MTKCKACGKGKDFEFDTQFDSIESTISLTKSTEEALTQMERALTKLKSAGYNQDEPGFMGFPISVSEMETLIKDSRLSMVSTLDNEMDTIKNLNIDKDDIATLRLRKRILDEARAIKTSIPVDPNEAQSKNY